MGSETTFWPLENGFLMRKKSSRRNISTNAYILKSLSWSIGNITTYWEIVLGFFGLQSRCVVHLNSSEAVLVFLESYCASWGVVEQKCRSGVDGMVIIGQWAPKSTFGANNAVVHQNQ